MPSFAQKIQHILNEINKETARVILPPTNFVDNVGLAQGSVIEILLRQPPPSRPPNPSSTPSNSPSSGPASSSSSSSNSSSGA